MGQRGSPAVMEVAETGEVLTWRSLAWLHLPPAQHQEGLGRTVGLEVPPKGAFEFPRLNSGNCNHLAAVPSCQPSSGVGWGRSDLSLAGGRAYATRTPLQGFGSAQKCWPYHTPAGSREGLHVGGKATARLNRCGWLIPRG